MANAQGPSSTHAPAAANAPQCGADVPRSATLVLAPKSRRRTTTGVADAGRASHARSYRVQPPGSQATAAHRREHYRALAKPRAHIPLTVVGRGSGLTRLFAAIGLVVALIAVPDTARSVIAQSQSRVGVAPPPRTSADDARLIEALAIAPGATVAEIGAGSGAMTIRMAREVGTTGRIYSSELGDKQLRDLRKAVTDAGVTNITVVDGDPNQTRFPDACCDALFMQNVYHHFADPTAMNASILRALKPGGRIAVMDFAPRNGASSPPAERADDGGKHGVTADTVKSELTAAGFEFVRSESLGRDDNRAFLVVMRKPG